jgi:hypothetical protein
VEIRCSRLDLDFLKDASQARERCHTLIKIKPSLDKHIANLSHVEGLEV